MALLFMDGFDVGDYAVKGWDSLQAGGSGGAVSLTSGRISGSGIQVSQPGGGLISNIVFRRAHAAINRVTVGFAVLPSALDAGASLGITLHSDAGVTPHLTFMNNSSTRVLELRRGDHTGTLLASSALMLSPGNWRYFEIRATINDTTGSCEVRVDGNTTPIINFTGDTRNGGTLTTFDMISLRAYKSGTTGAATGVFDDLYILDDTGTTNTTFLGDVRAITLRPDGAGADTQLAPTGSATNWQNVDETAYSTVDYNASATVGQRDTYTLSNLPLGMGTVHAVQSNLIAAKSDATTANARIPLRSGGALYYGMTTALSTSYLTFSDVYQLNPNTSSSWTQAAVDGLEVGMEVA